eukprot:CAMPEP_0204420830 /NCGR_PEP_ID=MMETSP0470-20130426/33397_1 /ASSEMBLY_ACC=CAM_ASM_000385 /TAXON_ID=2969 /ORGANISM="Oxyrrhis marina" /LENGTH=167 /DNA_ID=CAMNT_0051417835 /DNA_START=93 /DNA_END=592 /DNA_ORIENTATION=+
MMRVALLSTGVASTHRIWHRAATTPAPEAEADACDSLAGLYETGAARMTGANGEVYLSTPGAPHHGHGRIGSTGKCSCTGNMTFADSPAFEWRYDAFACTLSWHSAAGGPSSLVNTWTKDGSCARVAACDPAPGMDTAHATPTQAREAASDAARAADAAGGPAAVVA